MRFRPLVCLLAGLAAGLPSVLSAEDPAPEGATSDAVTIVRVHPGWRDAATFKRISEYFTGRENTGGETIVRTHPEERAGYYFQLRVRHPGTERPITVTVHIITADRASRVTHPFTTTLKDGDTMLQLGLTGADWPDSKANPVAWKLEVADASGRILATEQSYVWEKPATQ